MITLRQRIFLKLLMTCLSVFNISCGTGVVRPNIDACWVNDKSEKCEIYNTMTDYDNDGYRLPDAKLKYRSLSRGLRDLRGNLCINANGQKELIRFMDETRKWIKEHQQCLR